MGDRANVVLQFEDDTELYLYTHWAGTEWPEELRQALQFGVYRWYDEPYLARIIISRMFSDLVDSETGGGISPYKTDNEHPLIYVDLNDQTVTISGKKWSFAEYVAQTKATYPKD